MSPEPTMADVMKRLDAIEKQLADIEFTADEAEDEAREARHEVDDLRDDVEEISRLIKQPGEGSDPLQDIRDEIRYLRQEFERELNRLRGRGLGVAS